MFENINISPSLPASYTDMSAEAAKVKTSKKNRMYKNGPNTQIKWTNIITKVNKTKTRKMDLFSML